MKVYEHKNWFISQPELPSKFFIVNDNSYIRIDDYIFYVGIESFLKKLSGEIFTMAPCGAFLDDGKCCMLYEAETVQEILDHFVEYMI